MISTLQYRLNHLHVSGAILATISCGGHGDDSSWGCKGSKDRIGVGPKLISRSTATIGGAALSVTVSFTHTFTRCIDQQPPLQCFQLQQRCTKANEVGGGKERNEDEVLRTVEQPRRERNQTLLHRRRHHGSHRWPAPQTQMQLWSKRQGHSM